ncbi:MAG: hypothetical protein EXS17_02545 [Phycisphaerales bacterium]|nr:hypothetical protein [Phycisphaerales bacterium]
MRLAERALSVVVALFIALVVLAQTPVPAAVGAIERDDWFAISIADFHCGWLHEQVVVRSGHIETSNEMRLTVGRGGSQATISVQWRFEEDLDGTPISCTVEQTSAGEKSQTTYRFTKDHIDVHERAAGRTTMREMPVPTGLWLTPAQVERTIGASRRNAVARVEYRTVDPAAGLNVVDFVTTRSAESAGDGSLSQWKTRNSAVALETIESVDGAGRTITTRTKMAIGDMVARRCSESEAKRPAAAGGLDVIGRSIVALARPEPKLLTAPRARLAVKSSDGTLIVLPSSGSQRIETNPAGGLFVDVEVGRRSAATPQEVADSRYSASTILIDAADPAVRELALRAVAGAGLTEISPASARAEAMRALVMRFIIHKDLATAFAGASAVVQSRAGDCSEHAILLAALLRAQHIPSRVASGLVYADEFAGKRGIFAWHMWTQAQVDGHWIDLDATLDKQSFHPGHLLIATSAQDDAQLDSDFSALLATIGNVTIEVVNVD